MTLINGEEMSYSVENKPTDITFFVSKNCLFDTSFPHLKLLNLPSITTESSLYDILKKKYSILGLYMTRDNRNGRIGVADIEFEKEEDCKRCLNEMNGKRMNGRIINAEIVNNNNPASSPSKGDGGRRGDERSGGKKDGRGDRRDNKTEKQDRKGKEKVRNNEREKGKDKKESKDDDDDEKLCIVCLDRPKVMAILPCGHMCLCEKCGEMYKKDKTKTCPECRRKIEGVYKIFG